jgi:dolichol-phosphate mannosyltransferase
MKKVSIIVPFLNEEGNIPVLYEALAQVARREREYLFEFLFVNDGSRDKSASIIERLAQKDPRITYVEFSRNFGKEIATSAGLHKARGDCAIMLDADLQHPPQLIPRFIERWENGAEVVTGVRESSEGAGFLKKLASRLYYALMRRISDTTFVPGETDFRLLDRAVIDAFNSLSERQRMTRALINWLGFTREEIRFTAPARHSGVAQYSSARLIRLGVSSFVSHSLLPLRLAGYLGILITILSFCTGLFVFFERYVYHDPFGFNFSGPAQLAIINVFLVGITLSALGLIALYIENIKVEVSGRPLYIVRRVVSTDTHKNPISL